MYYVPGRTVRIFGFAALAALAGASWWSVRLARADRAFREGSTESVALAVDLLPKHTEYLMFQALQRDYDAADPTPLLERAAAISPLASAPRIRIGLNAEASGDDATAERWLLDAARVDRQYEPRWTLANYYFRRQNHQNGQNMDAFWQWIHAALAVSYGDRRAAFDLCWRVGNDGGQILEHAIPPQSEVLASYVAYLLYGPPRPEALASAALRLAAAHRSDYDPLIYGATTALIAAGRVEQAADVWQSLGYPRPQGVTHPDFETPQTDFETPQTAQGFDWRWSEVPGVTHFANRIAFNGQEPESCEILRQTVRGVRPGTRYRLRWEARTQGMHPPSGLEWKLGSSAGPVNPSDQWTPGEAAFTASGPWFELQLTYHRPLGETRAEGWIELRHVTIAQ